MIKLFNHKNYVFYQHEMNFYKYEQMNVKFRKKIRQIAKRKGLKKVPQGWITVKRDIVYIPSNLNYEIEVPAHSLDKYFKIDIVDWNGNLYWAAIPDVSKIKRKFLKIKD